MNDKFVQTLLKNVDTVKKYTVWNGKFYLNFLNIKSLSYLNVIQFRLNLEFAGFLNYQRKNGVYLLSIVAVFVKK